MIFLFNINCKNSPNCDFCDFQNLLFIFSVNVILLDIIQDY